MPSAALAEPMDSEWMKTAAGRGKPAPQAHVTVSSRLNCTCSSLRYMIDSAGFMTTPLPIMVPMYRWWEVPFLFIAGKMYDFVAGGTPA